uniref:ATP synthase subunit a n=1 Tax=Acerentomon microrhinus TaxID=996308 RepID=A0A0C4FSR7_9HEXA|nr:ATP synthase F0 subunit 6 [Acerentomon microrhinus]AFI54920.1 ATP synthase F0 subunit 6 [Acerentomon microrhinus]
MILMNLFSVFDPVSYFHFSLNWEAMGAGLLMTAFTFWPNTPKVNMPLGGLMKIYNEMKMLMSGMSSGKSIMFLAVILFILRMNLFGLWPYVFTYSSHFVLTFSLALPMWAASVMYGVKVSVRHFMAHLIPAGTSWALVSFIALAELISMSIRPVTLAIRLMTNMIAGHLLLSLLSGQAFSNFNYIWKWLVLLIQVLLLALELGVSFVQSYVFSILVLLYLIEVN